MESDQLPRYVEDNDGGGAVLAFVNEWLGAVSDATVGEWVFLSCLCGFHCHSKLLLYGLCMAAYWNNIAYTFLS